VKHLKRLHPPSGYRPLKAWAIAFKGKAIAQAPPYLGYFTWVLEFSQYILISTGWEVLHPFGYSYFLNKNLLRDNFLIN
jgi:hypothetical protein